MTWFLHITVNTDLSPAFDGALTLVSRPKAEAAGAAVRIGGVKIEGAFLTSITPDTSNISLKYGRNYSEEVRARKDKKTKCVRVSF